MHTHTHAHMHTYIHAHVHTHAHIRTCIHAHVYTHAHMHTYIHAHMHIHTCKMEMRAVRTMIISKQTKKGRKRERKIARAWALLKVSTCVCDEHLQ